MSRLSGAGYDLRIALAAVCFALFMLMAVVGPGAFAAERATANCAEPPTGLVAWWGGDGNAADVFGTYGGTLVNDTSYAVGKVGSAFSFDGDGDRVDMIGSNVGDFQSRPFTVEFWLYPNSVGANDFVIGKNYANSGLGWDMRLDAQRILVVGVNGWDFNITSDASATTGAWHHIALSSTLSEVKLYIDGVFKGSCPRSTISSTGNPLRFGFTTDYGSPALNGLMDEIKIYDRGLSEVEVLDIFNADADGSCRPCAAVPADAMAWWRAEDDTTDTFGDNDGTLNGDAGYAAGKVGKAFDFDGDGDYVALPDVPLWDFGTGSFSLVSWFKTASVSEFVFFLSARDWYGTGGGWEFGLTHQGKANFHIIDEMGGISMQGIQSPGSYDDDQWHMMVGVRDAVAGELRLYVDGVEVQSPVSESGLNVVRDPATQALIGALHSSSGPTPVLFYNGLIDEPMIFDRALTLEEIQMLANADSSGLCTECIEAPSDLVSWWQSEGDTTDSAGDNDGVLNGDVGYIDGKVGQAFDLDGDGDYIVLPGVPLWDFGTGSFSLVSWFKTSTVSDFAFMLSSRDWYNAGGGWALELTHQGKASFEIIDQPGGISTNAVQSPGEYDDEQWHMAVGVRDAVAGELRLYVDGAEVQTPSSDGGFNVVSDPGTQVLIGAMYAPEGNVSLFNGQLDEPMVFERALSRDEVYTLYSAGNHGVCEPPDTVPVPFAFVDQTYAAISTTVASAPISVAGINTATPVMISACSSTSCEYSVNGGAWTASGGTVLDGDSVEVRQTSSATYGTTTDLTLDIGGVTDTFSVTTLVQHTLTVTLVGEGTGVVSSTPAGIDCPTTACSAPFDETDSVVLGAVPDPGSVFSGWSGDADCADGTVSMTVDVQCTARFSMPFFADGFESGDTDMWDMTFP